MKERFTGQVDPVERIVAPAQQRDNALVGSIVNCKMDRYGLQVVIAQVEGNKADMVIVQVDGVEIALLNVPGHSLANSSVQN